MALGGYDPDDEPPLLPQSIPHTPAAAPPPEQPPHGKSGAQPKKLKLKLSQPAVHVSVDSDDIIPSSVPSTPSNSTPNLKHHHNLHPFDEHRNQAHVPSSASSAGTIIPSSVKSERSPSLAFAQARNVTNIIEISDSETSENDQPRRTHSQTIPFFTGPHPGRWDSDSDRNQDLPGVDETPTPKHSKAQANRRGNPPQPVVSTSAGSASGSDNNQENGKFDLLICPYYSADAIYFLFNSNLRCHFLTFG